MNGTTGNGTTGTPTIRQSQTLRADAAGSGSYQFSIDLASLIVGRCPGDELQTAGARDGGDLWGSNFPNEQFVPGLTVESPQGRVGAESEAPGGPFGRGCFQPLNRLTPIAQTDQTSARPYVLFGFFRACNCSRLCRISSA